MGYGLVGGFFEFFFLAMRAGGFRRRERRQRKAKEVDRVLNRFVRSREKSKLLFSSTFNPRPNNPC